MLPRSLNREFAIVLKDVARMIQTYADHKANQFGILGFGGDKNDSYRLCESGMIERRSDPGDRRAKRLFLTAAARPLIERLGVLGEDLMATALLGVDRESVEKMVTQLAIVKENLRRAIQQKNAAGAAGEQRYG